MWRAGRAVPLEHALDILVDHMEHQLGGPQAGEPAADVLPLSTGLLPLDRVLGGGIWRGTVVVIEADILAQGRALLATVARSNPYRCLFDGRRFLETVAWLLAGSARVPEVGIADVCMSKREWDAVVQGLGNLRRRDVLVSSTGSLGVLAGVADSSDAEVVLVHEADRFGPPIEFVPKLARMASTSGTAVLASTQAMGDLPDWALEGVVRLGMHGFDLGGRASLVRSDPYDMLVVAQVDVECLSGVVR